MLIAGGLCALTAVAAGAFGAHGLRGRIDTAMIATFETGARYQMYHALALLATALAAARWPQRLWTLAAIGFVAGVVMFSGSLYVLSLTGWRSIAWVTPLGGLIWLLAWGLFCAAALRIRRVVLAPPETATAPARR